MAISEAIKKNPFAAVGLFLTLLGVASGVVNFLILTNIQPLDTRIRAIEKEHVQLVEQHEEQAKILERFVIVETKVTRIERTVDKIADRLGVIN